MENQGKYNGAHERQGGWGCDFKQRGQGETHRELIKQRREGGREKSTLRRMRDQCKDSEDECGRHAQGGLGGQCG